MPTETPAGETGINDVVSIEINGSVGLIALDNPPVNAASHAIRSGLWQAVETLQQTDGVEVIALYAKGTDLHCRCRHSRIRQAAARPVAARTVQLHRKRLQADRLHPARHHAWWRPGSCHVVPRARRLDRIQGGLAGSDARHSAGRRRHPGVPPGLPVSRRLST